MIPERTSPNLGRVRQESIVGVLKNDVLTLRLAEPAVPGDAHALILLPHATDSREARQGLDALISRTIIHNHHFDRRASLVESAAQ